MGVLSQTSKRAVFLDRDGVINQTILKNEKPDCPRTLDELVIIDQVFESLNALRAAGFLLIVVTNQPNVARGSACKNNIEEINSALKQKLALDAFYTCYHDDLNNCACRKPKPGLILEASKAYGLDPKSCYLVGDRWRDIGAGKTAGCTTFFIDYGYDEQQPKDFDFRVHSLYEATQIILKKEGK